MHAVCRVDLQPRRAVFLHDFIHARGAIARFGRGVFRRVHIQHQARMAQAQMHRLVFFMRHIRQLHTAESVKRDFAVGLRIINRLAGGGFFQAAVVGAVVLNRPRRAPFEQIKLQARINLVYHFQAAYRPNRLARGK